MMRVEAPVRTIDRLAGSDHYSVEIQRHDAKRATGPGLEGDITKEFAKTIAEATTDVLQPARERSF